MVQTLPYLYYFAEFDKPRNVTLFQDANNPGTSLQLKFNPPEAECLYHICELLVEKMKLTTKKNTVRLDKTATATCFNDLEPNHFYVVEMYSKFKVNDTEVEGERVLSNKFNTGE